MEREELKAYIQAVAEKLNETSEQPMHQVELLVEHMGQDFVEHVLTETYIIEARGGLKTEDGTRRRTIGGVFFYLAKGKLPPDKRVIVFPNFGQEKRGRVLEWHERREYVDALLAAQEHGELQISTITLQGRPGKVEIIENSVITTIAHEAPRNPLPRGVPHPQEFPLVYVVYMGIKHWQGVEENLKKFRKDMMIVEGNLSWDAETQTLAVLANYVSTRRLERAKLQERAEGADGSEKKEAAPKPEKAPKPERPEKPKAERPEKAPKPEKPAKKPVPAKPEIELPEGIPPTVASKLRQFYSAAETLRERIKEMESSGNTSGVAMTKRLLENTEKQIKALEKQHIN